MHSSTQQTRNWGDFKKIVFINCIALISLFFPSSPVFGAEKEIFKWMINPRSIAPEWSYINGFQFSLGQLRDLENRFAVRLKDVRQQYFSHEGVVVEANYYEANSLDSAASLYQKLSRIKQRQSFLALVGKVVLDFTSPEFEKAFNLSKKIKGLPDIFYSRLLHHQLPSGWKIIAEVAQPSSMVKKFKRKLLSRVDQILHQLLVVDGTKVQLNIIESPNIYERARLADWLRSNVPKRNLVVEHENLTLELSSVSLGRSFAVADFFVDSKKNN